MGKCGVESPLTDQLTDLPPIIVITGPTAVGKSAVALELGARFGAEIISADSRQIYRYLDIGTAKPTAAERAALPHHLIDVVDPDQYYSSATFRDDAERVMADLKRRGRVGLLVGGSYHYLQTVLERLEIPRVPPQPELRGELESFAHQNGAQALHDRLRELDPSGADQIAATNVRRVVRALEVCRVTGQRFSDVGRRRGAPLPALRLGITTDRASLYCRIDARIDQQIKDGLLVETRRVLDMGYDAALPPPLFQPQPCRPPAVQSPPSTPPPLPGVHMAAVWCAVQRQWALLPACQPTGSVALQKATTPAVAA